MWTFLINKIVLTCTLNNDSYNLIFVELLHEHVYIEYLTRNKTEKFTFVKS